MINFNGQFNFIKESRIDCEDCKNYWLINEKKEKQVINPYCLIGPKKQIFYQENQAKLSQKCK